MKLEFFGIDVAEALNKASRKLGTGTEQLVYRVLDERFGHPLKQQKVGIVVEVDEDRLPESGAAAAEPGAVAAETGAVTELQLHKLQDQPVEKAVFALQQMLKYLGIAGSISHESLPDFVLITVHFEEQAPDFRRGEARELRGAVQYLINRIVHVEGESEQRFVVDFGGNLADRREQFGSLAGALSEKVMQLKKPIRIQMMDAQERRLLHTALLEDQRVSTFSQGEGRFRVMCIQPKGAQGEPGREDH